MTGKPSQDIGLYSLLRFGQAYRCALLAGWFVLGSLVISGCSHITQRGQSPDAEAMEFDEQVEDVVYVSDIGRPTGLDKLKVDGIALVTQLDDTGSEPRASAQRDFLVAEIKTHQVDDIPGLLASKENSMALVMGQIPPAAKKGDRFDLMVGCMPRSKTMSLAGGFLMQSRLKPFVSTGNSVHFGHNSAMAEGRIVVDSLFESGNPEKNNRNGIIMGGGVVTRDRATGLLLMDQHRSIKNATAVSRAINARFSTRIHGNPEGVANPVSDRQIEVLVPEDYRHNVGRYFHVILNMVFNESAGQRVNRLERLERELHSPERSRLSAIRLEAIGDDARGVLKRGLRNADLQVRFQAAQALAYMGDGAGVETLREAAEVEPAFRWHAFTALASIRNSDSEKALAQLFDTESAETRYGAFRTLRESVPSSRYVAGEFVGREFHLHTVPSAARPMIHVSRAKVPELVFFGERQQFNERLLYIESGLTVKSIGQSRIELKRYQPGQEEAKLVCSSLVTDVIRNMVRLGADYGDVVAMLKDARQTQALETQLVINAVPRLTSGYRTTTASRPATGERSEKYVSEPMPEMFDDSGSVPSADAVTTKRGKGIFGRLGGLWNP